MNAIHKQGVFTDLAPVEIYSRSSRRRRLGLIRSGMIDEGKEKSPCYSSDGKARQNISKRRTSRGAPQWRLPRAVSAMGIVSEI